jgi:hypothetical protein
MTAVQSKFSLADITDRRGFRQLGERLATDPEGELSRTLVGARIVVGADGIKRTELVRSEAADRIKSIPSLFSIEERRSRSRYIRPYGIALQQFLTRQGPLGGVRRHRAGAAGLDLEVPLGVPAGVVGLHAVMEGICGQRKRGPALRGSPGSLDVPGGLSSDEQQSLSIL